MDVHYAQRLADLRRDDGDNCRVERCPKDSCGFVSLRRSYRARDFVHRPGRRP